LTTKKYKLVCSILFRFVINVKTNEFQKISNEYQNFFINFLLKITEKQAIFSFKYKEAAENKTKTF
jgi:hypothetical protein